MRVFVNAIFHSCEEEDRVFTALAEEKGQVAWVGEEAELPPRFQKARRVDLGGRCAVPAFGDTHMHFESYALFGSTVDVREARDFAQMGELLRAYLERHPKAKFLPAYGCSAHTVAEKRLPRRQDLDRMVTVPLLIVKYDGHAAVANSALIAQFPPEVTGDPGFDPETGWLYQNAFYRGVNHITAQVPPLAVLGSMTDAAQRLAERGIGFVHTVEGVGYKNDIDIDTIRFTRYGLPQAFRVFFQTMEVEKVKKRGMERIGGCFSLALDGCFGSEDAALSRPYENDPGNTGFLAYSQEEVNAFCVEANRAGLQIAVHAIGDRAVEQAIVAFETALADCPRRDHRHTIIHADLIPPALQDRAAALGLQIALQPPFLDWAQEPGDYLEEILGDRAREIIPLRSLLDRGILLSAGSDAPCTLPDPIQSIHACCNHPDPAQRLTPLEALKLHTLWAARASFDEGRHGSLVPGAVCDLAVLEKDPLALPPERQRENRVAAVYLRGRPLAPARGGPLGLVCRSAWNWLFARDLK